MVEGLVQHAQQDYKAKLHHRRTTTDNKPQLKFSLFLTMNNLLRIHS